MSDNQNLPINVGAEREVGTITYANEVIAIIAGMATYEVEGVFNATAGSSGIADLFGRKPITRGVKVEVGTEETSVDLTITVEYGEPIQKVATEVQENVRKAIETMTGLHVLKVDIHVSGISFEKEKEEMEESYVKATASVEESTLSPQQEPLTPRQEELKEYEEFIEDPENDPDSAETNVPPEGVDPDTLPIRNIHMNDGRMKDEAEEASARMKDTKEEG